MQICNLLPIIKKQRQNRVNLKSRIHTFPPTAFGAGTCPKIIRSGMFFVTGWFCWFPPFPLDVCGSMFIIQNIGVLQKSVHCPTFLFRGLKRSGVRKKRDVPKKKLASRRNGPMWPRRGFSGSQGSFRNGVGRSWENHFSQPRRIFKILNVAW